MKRHYHHYHEHRHHKRRHESKPKLDENYKPEYKKFREYGHKEVRPRGEALQHQLYGSLALKPRKRGI